MVICRSSCAAMSDETQCPRCGTRHDTPCSVCGGWHKEWANPDPRGCCRRQTDRDHVCGRPTPDPFCESCTAVVGDVLTRVPENYVRLSLALLGEDAGRDVHTLGFESRIPMAVAASDLMRDAVGLLTGWEDAVRESTPGYAKRPAADRTAPALAGQAGPTVEASSKFLGRRVGQLLGLDAESGNELIGWHRRVLFVLGQDRRRDIQYLPEMPCPDCGRRTLFREYGSDLVQCDAGVVCRVWTREQHKHLAAIAASDFGRPA